MLIMILCDAFDEKICPLILQLAAGHCLPTIRNVYINLINSTHFSDW